MPRDYIPDREADLVGFVGNFKTLIVATPIPFGLTAAQATAYTARYTAFMSAFTTATTPATRTRPAIIAKDAARAALVADTRLLAQVIQKCPTVTNEQRAELGLTVRSTVAPIPVPATAPKVLVLSAVGRTLRVRLIDPAHPTRRGKPAGVDGAMVLSHVGPTPPADLSAWKMEGNSSVTTFDMAFDPAVPAGATVWITAFWFNPRKQSGPACDPVSANLPGGGVSAMAA